MYSDTCSEILMFKNVIRKRISNLSKQKPTGNIICYHNIVIIQQFEFLSLSFWKNNVIVKTKGDYVTQMLILKRLINFQKNLRQI